MDDHSVPEQMGGPTPSALASAALNPPDGLYDAELRFRSPSQTAPERRPDNITFIRWALAVMVVWSHSFELAGRVSPFALLSHRQGLGEGAIAVDAFFLLSGYLVLQSREHSACACDFARRRILRIYPGYLVLSLVGILLFWRPFSYVMLTSLSTLQPLPINPFNGNPHPDWDGQMWTVCYEGLCYALLAAFWAIGGFRLSWPLLGLTAGVLIYHWQTLGSALGWQDPGRFFAYFAIGCVFYKFRAALTRPNKRVFVACLAVLAVCAALPWVAPVKLPLVYVLPLALPYALFYLSFHCRPVRWTKDDLSYGTYCWAWPISSAIIWMTGGVCPSLLIFALTLLLVTPVAMASWRYVEKPALAFKKMGIHRPPAGEALADGKLS